MFEMLVRCHAPTPDLHPPRSLHTQVMTLLEILIIQAIWVMPNMHDPLLDGATEKGLSLLRSWEKPACL